MTDWADIISSAENFEWDEGNIKKNREKHHVSHIECEEIFFNKPVIVKKDDSHSTSEDRYFAIGKTDAGRSLFTVFTLRGNRIRIISARDMSRKERKIYEETQEDTQI